MRLGRKSLAAAGLGVGLIVVAGLAFTAISRSGWSSRSGGFSESPTGSMNVARANPIAARLNDGRVLVIGGTDVWREDYAEIYDPRSGRFSVVDSMKLPGLSANAVVLRDGRVLIVGAEMKTNYGGDDYTPFPSRWSYLFDPKTGKYTQTAPMNEDRADSAATLLRDGRVLIAGGCYRCHAYYHHSYPSAEIYDPKTNEYTPTAPMITERAGHSATLLTDGRVLVVGGGYDAGAEIYDPSSGKFTPTGHPLSRGWHQASFPLADGRVLVLDEWALEDKDGPPAELFDPASGTFSATGSVQTPRAWFDAALLRDGRVLVIGGITANDKPVASVEAYDARTGKFSAVGSLGHPRDCPLLTALADGRVLLAGGCAPPPIDKDPNLDTAEILTVR